MNNKHRQNLMGVVNLFLAGLKVIITFKPLGVHIITDLQLFMCCDRHVLMCYLFFTRFSIRDIKMSGATRCPRLPTSPLRLQQTHQIMILTRIRNYERNFKINFRIFNENFNFY